MNESTIQRTVFHHLRMRGVPGVFAFHPPNGGYRRPIEAKILKGMGVVAGVPDVMIMQAHGGGCRVFGLELKTEIGRLSDAQMETQIKMELAGVTAFNAYGLDQAIHALEYWGLVKGSMSS
jgi:hypothetical protein